MRSKLIILFILATILPMQFSYAQKNVVWIISDVNENCITTSNGSDMIQRDNVVALAWYLLMSNHFDTKGVVVSSCHYGNLLSGLEDQSNWASRYFGEAYKKDLPNLNKEIGGYQNNIHFVESYLKDNGKRFSTNISYSSLKNYSSVGELYNLIKESKEIVNVICWGTLTEPAILVKHCKEIGREDLLKKVRFISNCANSDVSTLEYPGKTNNYLGDNSASLYMKNEALNGSILLYECGKIGRYGVLDGAPRGKKYYDQFCSSNLGDILVGNYQESKDFIDGSNCVPFLVLLGNWGVSLNDINSNGTNPLEIERKNGQRFLDNSHIIHDELLRRSRVAAGAVSSPITNFNLFPGLGLTDGHTWIENGRLYLFGGHDQSWLTSNTWLMDRWEVWSTDNLKDWRYETKIEPGDTYIGNKPNCWAGDIVERGGKYYWYFSNRNIDTGVAVADSINGIYKDILKRPLLPKDIIKGNPYDPEIFVENDKYYIIFSAGTYYISELGDDMMSLKSEPKPIVILDDNGDIKGAQDKSSIMKRNDIYYLIWGDNYATSNKLEGPYLYKGLFMSGGHTNMFEWNNQWYVIQENKDLGLFYRGLSLKPIYFDRNGDVVIPTTDTDYPGAKHNWDFTANEMGWHSVDNGTVVEWDRKDGGMIRGEINGSAAIESATWILGDTKEISQLTITLKNNTKANKMQVFIASYNVTKGKFWEDNNILWNNEFSSLIDIDNESSEFVSYKIVIPEGSLKQFLKCVRVVPAVGVTEGSWEIKSILFE